MILFSKKGVETTLKLISVIIIVSEGHSVTVEIINFILKIHFEKKQILKLSVETTLKIKNEKTNCIRGYDA